MFPSKVREETVMCDSMILTGVQDNEDEFLLDAPDAVAAEGEIFAPQDDGADETMAIDEEGRPRFAPAKDIVCVWSRQMLQNVSR